MQKAIENFCQKRKNGLFLLDMPTGFGKTYNVLEFIAENCDTKEYKDTKFFFVTTLKKNLPFEDLRERFKEKKKEKYFEEKCIRIEANADVVIEKLLDLDETNKIPYEIKSKSSYQDLKEQVLELRKSGTKFIEKGIRESAERKFREDVIKELEVFRTSEKKLEAIQKNPKYQWIGELYPSVFTKEKQIFFLTIDKFLLEYSTLIEKSYLFYNHSIIENAIIFIDEFDATKERMMNQIIQRGLKNSINYIKLANAIDSSLKTKSFPSVMTTESKKRENYLKENPREKSCNQIIEGLKKVFGENQKRFFMQYSIRTEHKDRAENERNFLFNDFQFHSIFSNGNSFVQMKVDSQARQNWLCFSKQESIEQEVSLPEYLGSVRGSINYFLKAVEKLAVNYKQNQDENKTHQDDDDFSYENAITSVLEEFGVPDNFRYYMKMQILSKQQMRKNQKKLSDKKINKITKNLSIYDRGFRYFDFKDDPSHHMHSEIRSYDFSDSPESILLRIAERARVIGISATATLDTVIGNYSINYLKQMLGDAFYTLPKEDNDRLMDAFSEYTKGYNKVEIHVESVSCNDSLEKELKKIFNDEYVVSKFLEILENKFSGDAKNHAGRSFLRIVKVMKQFILNKDIRSFLCLSNKLAREGNHKLDLTLLREIAQEIKREANIKDDDKELVVSLDSEEYDEKHANLINRLSNGEKLFVLSSYQTIGAGQNLQYRTPDDVAVVNVNDFNRGDLVKDFDAIYLENPTHLLVNVSTYDSLGDEELIRYIFQMESLMGSGEISQNDGKSNIKFAFRKLSGEQPPRDIKIGDAYKTDSVNNAANRVLIQAVGRICRTGLKNKDIYIYLDEEIFTKHDITTVKHRMLNPEFVRIVETAPQNEKQRSEDSYVLKLENRASQLSSRHVQRINYLKRGWNPEKIEVWREIRELCLKYPTISKENYENYQNLYLQAPEKISRYSYSQEGDYQKNVTVKFDGSLPQKVSEEDARLQEILEIPEIKAYFEEKGYATEFTPSEYLLTPPMFNNIYKGALGEVAGKFILERFLGVELQEVSEDVFEFFDFKVGEDVYVDFKHWKDTMLVDAKKAKEKIIQKLNACKGKRAVIINILHDREMQITTSYDRRIVEIPCLYRTDLHQYDSRIIKEVIRKGYLR